MNCFLALTGGKSLFVFSLKTKSFGRKAGKWIAEKALTIRSKKQKGLSES
jgi:hypothetical protein